jgi:hypothetical protein
MFVTTIGRKKKKTKKWSIPFQTAIYIKMKLQFIFIVLEV